MDPGQLERLRQRILDRAHKYTSDPNPPRRHHLVSRFYLEPWTVDGVLRRTVVDTGRWRDLGAKGVGWALDFYRLEAEDLDPVKTPPLAAEVILGEFENIAKPHIDNLLDSAPGVVRDGELIADMSLYVAAQFVRGQTFRDEQLSLIDWSDRQDQTELTTRLARSLLTARAAGAPPAEAAVEQVAAAMRARSPISADPKVQSIELMWSMWLNLAEIIVKWHWTIYSSGSPLLTSDEPVTLIGRPDSDRAEKPGLIRTTAIVFPLSPRRLLVLFPPTGTRLRGPHTLTAGETREINTELMAYADTTVFEQPGTGIAASIEVPPRGPGKPLFDRYGNPARRYRKPSRWADSPEPPPPPIARWHTPSASTTTTGRRINCRILGCRDDASTTVWLPEVAEYARANRQAYDSDPNTPVCHDHQTLLRAAVSESGTNYSVDLRWRHPLTGHREIRIRYPA
ncbi:DUF4238 domain-containing protein [Nocardia salmonicida]|uniref:DUF4238 domain-containing protein n=1 Tax=Nocardia salmonicida TaxID=53431 RepID=UPI003798BAF4